MILKFEKPLSPEEKREVVRCIKHFYPDNVPDLSDFIGVLDMKEVVIPEKNLTFQTLKMINMKPNKQTQNQVHPTRKGGIDRQGNERKTLWLRDGRTTMPFVEGLTEAGCKVLINHINTFLIQAGKKTLPKTKFLITR